MDTNIRRHRAPDCGRSSHQLQSFAPEIQELTFSSAIALTFEQPVVPLTFENRSDDLFSSASVALSFEREGQSTRPATAVDIAEQTRLNFKSSRSLFAEWIVG